MLLGRVTWTLAAAAKHGALVGGMSYSPIIEQFPA